MKSRETIATLLESSTARTVTVKGWVRTFRANRFIALNDGSTINNIQCVVDFEHTDESILKRITTGAAIAVTGELQESQGKGQSVEIQVSNIEILGDSNPEEYPIQPKKHSFEFLRENAHLRIRTNTFGAVMRVRSALAFAIHEYFTKNGFYYFHSPIITGSDAEGAGEMFSVTTLNPDNLPKNNEGKTDYKKDFFGKHTNLTVSGQLEGETYAMGLGKIYTFGPTFRAENSNTTRHLAEFWMIEPEVAFNDLEDNIDLAEDFIKYVVSYALKNCKDDLEFLSNRLAQEEKGKPANERSEMTLLERLEFVVNNNFKRVSYTEAIDILRNSKPNKKKKFQYIIDEWGADLQSEHERYLVEKHFKCPVVLFDYPANIKAFYMRLNEDGKTVRAMDVLFPGIGEIVGGSQREERLDVLKEKMAVLGIDEKELWWYLDTRRFGTAVHSGFGLGFERLVQFATGMGNIRDVIPYPRTPQNAEF
ncbi:MAG: asparagine--tRNA ligase [Flavobacteriaceae bacterium]|nr:asparagine--tRNA ligase [Flavobacteriaceae bacterium]